MSKAAPPPLQGNRGISDTRTPRGRTQSSHIPSCARHWHSVLGVLALSPSSGGTHRVPRVCTRCLGKAGWRGAGSVAGPPGGRRRSRSCPRGPCPLSPLPGFPRGAGSSRGTWSAVAALRGRADPAGLGGGGGRAPGPGGAALYRSDRGMPSAGRGRRGAQGPGPAGLRPENPPHPSRQNLRQPSQPGVTGAGVGAARPGQR